MRRFARTVTWCAALVLASGFAPRARADDAKPPAAAAPPAAPAPSEGDVARAAELKSKGDAAMVAKNHVEALELYREVFAITKDPALLYNQGRALQALNRMPEALEMLQRFTIEAPPAVRAKVPKLAELVKDVEKRVCTLTVKVNETGATIRINDLEIGKSPLLEKPVTSGKVVLEVSKDGFEPAKRTYTLPGGAAFEIPVDLYRKDKSGILVIQSNVDGTSLTVDGKPVGQAPTEIQVPAGSHTIVATATEYEDASVEAVVGVGERKPVEVRLGSSPFYEQAWFWSVTGLALAGGAAAAITYAALTEKDPDIGSIDPGKLPVAAPGGFVIVVRSPVVRF